MDAKTFDRYPSLDLVECPYPYFTALHEEAPMYRVPETGEYLVSRHEDILHVLKRPEIFSNAAARQREATPGGRDTSSMIASDPPSHREKRNLCSAAFRPRRLRGYEPRIKLLVDGLIDEFIDRSHVEFVSEFATPLPILVFCDIFFGDAETDMDRFQRWALREGTGARYLPEDRREAAEQMRYEVIEYMDANILERYQNPRDDALTEIIQAQVDRDGELDVEYLRSEASLLLSGGFVTTAHLIANAMFLLLHDLPLLERVRADHDRIPPMIEEALRLESPVQWQQRVAVEDTEIGGVAIPAGSIVVVVLAAGNRDPDHYEEPEAADLGRPQLTRHLAFGHGIHFCLGAPLGRLEARIAFERLLARLTDIRLAPGRNDFQHLDSPLFRGLQQLHLEFQTA